MEKKDRAFELDALRGLAIFMMICHHFIWDVRYLLDYDLFEFVESTFFNYALQPFFLSMFIVISGICCTFSRNNLKRSLRLLSGAVAISIIMALVSVILLEIGVIDDLHRGGLFVFFNILHLLTVGTFLCWLIESFERTKLRSKKNLPVDTTFFSPSVNSALIIAALFIFLAEPFIDRFQREFRTYAFLPLGIIPENCVSMGDYLPIIPWLGVFLIGMALGRILYRDKRTAFPGAPGILRTISAPFEFIGRHSLLFYLVHQPILLAILFGGRYAELW
ncbi:MAG: DUF1624 domain-containing protein [Clostridiales bacterium]|nr:DUF1624 domain-containing protein [Clostridiales bacterium]